MNRRIICTHISTCAHFDDSSQSNETNIIWEAQAIYTSVICVGDGDHNESVNGTLILKPQRLYPLSLLVKH